MRILPKKISNRVLTMQMFATRWSENPTAIGLTEGQVATFAAQLQEAVDAVQRARQAQDAARLAVVMQETRLAEASRTAQNLINTIKAYAAHVGGIETLDAALVNPRADAAPPPPLRRAEHFSADPAADGSIVLRWKGSTANGHFYAIHRSIDGGPFTYLGSVGARKWTDKTVPAGSRTIFYRLYTQRGDKQSTESASTTVQLGVAPRPLMRSDVAAA